MNKICKCCGHVHLEIPADAKEWIDDEMKHSDKAFIIGYFWQCVCGSTMFHKVVENLVKSEAVSIFDVIGI